MSVVIVWEEIPDSTSFIVCEENSKLDVLATRSAGTFINQDDLPDDHPIFELYSLIEEQEIKKLYIPLYTGTISKIIVCGFIL